VGAVYLTYRKEMPDVGFPPEVPPKTAVIMLGAEADLKRLAG
jgi:hypothetical protein